jgi:MFS family permease
MKATPAAAPWQARLPFYFGWVVVGVAFVTMAIAVTARTAFSLLLPPLVAEFGWERGLVAGAFSFGFLVSAVLSPLSGRMMDRYGPRVVIGVGVALLGGGLLLCPLIATPWQLYAVLGVLVGGGGNLMSYSVQSQYLPNWFRRRRGLAISIAFSGVGVGAVTLLPWLQTIILRDGWRASCTAMGVLVVAVVGPLTLLLRRHPRELGLEPDGVAVAPVVAGRVADSAGGWTLRRALATGRFWWISLSYFCGLFAWYLVQVHQTEYLLEVGFSPLVAAWSLGVVSVVGIPGQIGLGSLSDRWGRETTWSIGCLGFALRYAALLGLRSGPSFPLLYVMVFCQGFLGYAMTTVMGPLVLEAFDGPHFGSIFGVVTLAAIGGGAAGPWAAGLIHDASGNYRAAFLLGIGACVVSSASIWLARRGPRADSR